MITEVEIHAWLCAKLASLDTSGMRNASLSISNHKDMPVSLYADPMDHYEYTGGSGMTAEAALAELRTKLPTLENLAKQKRAKAATLLAEAAKLEAEKL